MLFCRRGGESGLSVILAGVMLWSDGLALTPLPRRFRLEAHIFSKKTKKNKTTDVHCIWRESEVFQKKNWTGGPSFSKAGRNRRFLARFPAPSFHSRRFLVRGNVRCRDVHWLVRFRSMASRGGRCRPGSLAHGSCQVGQLAVIRTPWVGLSVTSSVAPTLSAAQQQHHVEILAFKTSYFNMINQEMLTVNAKQGFDTHTNATNEFSMPFQSHEIFFKIQTHGCEDVRLSGQLVVFASSCAVEWRWWWWYGCESSHQQQPNKKSSQLACTNSMHNLMAYLP